MRDTCTIYDDFTKMPDPDLIQALHRDEESGLVGIYRLYNKQLLFFAQKYVRSYQVAEEIVADVFVTLWERRLQFASLERVQAFLYIATKNRCLNHLRGTNVCDSIEDVPNFSEFICGDGDAFTKIVRTELLKMIYDEVQKLPAKQREVFNRTFLEDKTAEEIAKELNIAPNAVYANKSRALTTLRQNLQLKKSLFLLALFYVLQL